MSDVPIQNLMVSDFRRIEGTRVLPFDAPVVLIHGPNGTGKTSVLSALELALTGSVRSMERQDDRYMAHLPFLGQAYATVRADVAEYLQAGLPGVPMTVGGSRIDGPCALSDKVAQFYSERCYLDQASLGRLLEFYQTRVGNEESALAKFVSELLGLEKLDALRDGLSDANDLRLLKKLAAGIEDAAAKAKQAGVELGRESEILSQAKTELSQARAATREVVAAVIPEVTGDVADSELLRLAQVALGDDQTRVDPAKTEELHQELVALGGRISALSERPSTRRIHEARKALAAATAEHKMWDKTEGATVRAWEAAARTAGVRLPNEPRYAVEQAATLVQNDLVHFANIRTKVELVRGKLDADTSELNSSETRLSNAHEHSSALVEGLIALRTVVDSNNVCPVCDRDYSEVDGSTLAAYIESKLAELTVHGQQLLSLRTGRDQLAAKVTRAGSEYSHLVGQLPTADEQQALEDRQVMIVELAAQVEEIELAISRGADLAQRVRKFQLDFDSLDAASSESRYIEAELIRYAALLDVAPFSATEAFQGSWSQLLGQAETEVERVRELTSLHRSVAFESQRFAKAVERESVAIHRVAELVERKTRWEGRVAEAKRRQTVAKEVHDAATRARTTIVQRVFTDSLNEVWKNVFTRLAPSEGFIPKFGIPKATKTTLDIKLETTHRNGTAGGPPQMMLSAGNLNTAALSLFLALHLAVRPIMPCLVFDDPVQAMDEVHVSQFAGLIRVLAKQHGRQVVIAVHERELFDYLTLELSPAYEGDELITIELGERATDDDEGITRHTWKPDVAIAS
ncbi:AAA family ATPase [Arthrobacter sp. Hz1]